MTVKAARFSGTTAGAGFTTTGGTGDDPFALGTLAGAGAAIGTYQTSPASTSGRLLRINGASADQFRFYHSFTQDSRFRVCDYLTLTAAPSYLTDILWLVEGGTFIQRPQIQVTTARQLQVKDGANIVRSTFTTAMAVGTRYRVEMYGGLAAAPTTSNGTLTVALFVGDSTTAVETKSYTDFNLGTVGFIRVQRGKESVGGTYAADLDTLRSEIGTSSAPLGPAAAVVVTNAPPVVSAGPAQSVDAGQVVTLTGTDSDADGSITARGWRRGTALLSNTAALTLTTPISADDSTDTLTYFATDSGGLTSTSDVVLTTRRAPLIRKNADGSFTGFVLRTGLTGTPGGGSTVTVPGVMSAPTVTAGDARATVTWVAPASNGGAAVTGYDLQNVQTGAVTALGTVLSTTITGLVNGTAYTFKVRAKNSAGAATYSTASVAVTPTAPVAPPATTGNVRLTRDAKTGSIMQGSTVFKSTMANIYELAVTDSSNSPRLSTHAEIDALLDDAISLGHQIVRAHTLGIGIGPEPYQLVGGVTGTTNPIITYRQAVWDVIDYAVSAAGDRGLYLQVPLTDELGYYHGGKRTWVNFRRPGTCSTDGNVKSANSSTERTAENFFYTDAQIIKDFDTYIGDWLNHVNPLTGLAFKNDPTIAVVEIGNELWTADNFRGWTPARAARIKAVAPNVLVSHGMGADGSSFWLTNGTTDPLEHIINAEVLASPNVDVVEIHPYSYFTDADVTEGARRAKAAGKAFGVGEYAWSKSTAPGIEQAFAAAPNAFAIGYWSLWTGSTSHSGTAYGGDDAPLYTPGRDSTMNNFIDRIKALGITLAGGTTGGGSNGTGANLLPRASTAAMTTTDATIFTLGGATGTLAMDAASTPKSLLLSITGSGGYWYVYPKSVALDGAPVVPRSTVTGLVTVTPSLSGLLRAQLSWYDAAGNYLSGSTGPTVTAPANVPTQLAVPVTVPASAAFAAVQPVAAQSYAAGTTFRIAQLGVMDGYTTTWAAPGATTTPPPSSGYLGGYLSGYAG